MNNIELDSDDEYDEYNILSDDPTKEYTIEELTKFEKFIEFCKKFFFCFCAHQQKPLFHNIYAT